MESLVFAKGAAGQYFTDLVEACEDHFNRIYPECVNSTPDFVTLAPKQMQLSLTMDTKPTHMSGQLLLPFQTTMITGSVSITSC